MTSYCKNLVKKTTVGILFAFLLTFPTQRALAFGEAPILLQILSNAITQLHNLMTIVQQGKDTLRLTKEINSGLNDTLAVIQTLKSRPDLNLYRDWQDVDSSIRKIEALYGKIPKSNLSEIQSTSDHAAAEGITTSASLSKAAATYDMAGLSIQQRASQSSPKGAARLTAQGVGVMVQVMNESLRAQASALKLQAEAIAVDNSKEKSETKQLQSAAESLSKSFKSHKSNFKNPEF